MKKGTIFWMLMILWFVLGLYIGWDGRSYAFIGHSLLEFILLFLLGWHCFGFVVQD